MTQDEIIEMARQSGMAYEEKMDRYIANINDLEDFAKLVAAKEREEILRLCEPPEHSHQFVHTFKKIIRARGKA